VARLSVDHRQQQQLQVVRAEFAAARKTVAIAAEAAGAAAEAPATATAAACVVMTADRMPQRLRRKAMVAVVAVVAVMTCVGLEFAAAAVACGVAVKLARVAFAALAPVRALTTLTTRAALVAFTTWTTSAMSTQSVAGKRAALAGAIPLALRCLPLATSTVTAFRLDAAALAMKRLVTNERMPEFMERRTGLICVKTFVRATRTGKTMLMSHSGHSRECLKMCLKIYI
jgi:hypothetical protein